MSTEVQVNPTAPALPLDPVAPPLKLMSDDSIRVGGTRVLLQTVVIAHLLGNTPAEIVESYPVLAVKDVYAVIAFYLAHKEAVDAYLSWIEADGKQIQASIEARPGYAERAKRIDEKLEAARRAGGKEEHKELAR